MSKQGTHLEYKIQSPKSKVKAETIGHLAFKGEYPILF